MKQLRRDKCPELSVGAGKSNADYSSTGKGLCDRSSWPAVKRYVLAQSKPLTVLKNVNTFELI